MAYMNFADLASLTAPVTLRHSGASDEAGLSALEWSVVALAQRDSLSSLRAPGRLAQAMAVIFGGGRPENPVADPRLEALRRVSVHAWHRGFAVPESETRGFYEAGYSPDQLELLLTSISRARNARRRRI